jgi:acetyl-CoA synthetase
MTVAAAPNAPFNLARYTLNVAGAPRHKAALEVFSDAAAAPVEIWTYGELEDAVLRVAGGLSDMGMTPGSRLLIRLANTSAYPILFLGAIAAGLAPIPASSLLTASEADFLLEDSGAAMVAIAPDLTLSKRPPGVRVITERDVVALMRTGRRADYAPTLSEDPAYLIYTSGTTAKPKGVVHAQRVVLGRRPMFEGWYGISSADRVLHAGAFNWTYTLGVGLLDPWANGATSLIFTGDKKPDIWPPLIRQSGASIFAAVPGLMRQILKYAPLGQISLGRLRHGLVAGEKPPDELFDNWRQRTGTNLYEALGMSEISTYISTSPSTPRKSGAVGRAQPSRRIAILPVDGGEAPAPAGQTGLIAVHRSDPGLMLGYWKRPEEQAEVFRGEWFIGGDLGAMDADGYISHLGRANDLIKALGYRVSPQEVEAAISDCPGVGEVACAELCVRDGVSVVGAFVIRTAGAALDAETVKAFAEARLASYKCPREVVFVESFPRTANGKVRRCDLAATYAAAARD